MSEEIIRKTCASKVVSDLLFYLYNEEKKTKKRPSLKITDLTEKASLPYIPSSETDLLAGQGLILKESRGRPKYISLTDLGFNYVKLMLEFRQKVSNLFS